MISHRLLHGWSQKIRHHRERKKKMNESPLVEAETLTRVFLFTFHFSFLFWLPVLSNTVATGGAAVSYSCRCCLDKKVFAASKVLAWPI